MAKYNWKKLEQEYILSEYKSVSSFLKDKGIPNNGSTKKSTKGWKNKKVLKEEQKSTKIIEKVLEKESEKEASKKITINTVAETLLDKIVKLSTSDEVDVKNIKTLTSALKDVNDVMDDKDKDNNNDGILTELVGALKNVKKD